jgi:hypothetical protein
MIQILDGSEAYWWLIQVDWYFGVVGVLDKMKLS